MVEVLCCPAAATFDAICSRVTTAACSACMVSCCRLLMPVTWLPNSSCICWLKACSTLLRHSRSWASRIPGALQDDGIGTIGADDRGIGMKLTPCEQIVLAGVIAGQSNKEIAQTRGRGLGTVKYQMQMLLEKKIGRASC